MFYSDTYLKEKMKAFLPIFFVLHRILPKYSWLTLTKTYFSCLLFRVTPTFADDIKIYTSQLKSSYTIAYNFWYDLQRIEIFTRKILIVQSRGYDYDLQLQNSWLLLSCPFFLASGLSFMDFRVNEPDQRCIKGSRFAALHIVLQMWFMFKKSI